MFVEIYQTSDLEYNVAIRRGVVGTGDTRCHLNPCGRNYGLGITRFNEELGQSVGVWQSDSGSLFLPYDREIKRFHTTEELDRHRVQYDVYYVKDGGMTWIYISDKEKPQNNQVIDGKVRSLVNERIKSPSNADVNIGRDLMWTPREPHEKLFLANLLETSRRTTVGDSWSIDEIKTSIKASEAKLAFDKGNIELKIKSEEQKAVCDAKPENMKYLNMKVGMLSVDHRTEDAIKNTALLSMEYIPDDEPINTGRHMRILMEYLQRLKLTPANKYIAVVYTPFKGYHKCEITMSVRGGEKMYASAIAKSKISAKQMASKKIYKSLYSKRAQLVDKVKSGTVPVDIEIRETWGNSGQTIADLTKNGFERKTDQSNPVAVEASRRHRLQKTNRKINRMLRKYYELEWVEKNAGEMRKLVEEIEEKMLKDSATLEEMIEFINKLEGRFWVYKKLNVREDGMVYEDGKLKDLPEIEEEIEDYGRCGNWADSS